MGSTARISSTPDVTPPLQRLTRLPSLLRLLCVSVTGGVSRKTFIQFSKSEKREKRAKRCPENVKRLPVYAHPLPSCPAWVRRQCVGAEPGGAPLGHKAPLWVDPWLGGESRETTPNILGVKKVKT